MSNARVWHTFIAIVLLTIVSLVIALPLARQVSFSVFGQELSGTFGAPAIDLSLFGRRFNPQFTLKQGLDIQGGMQVVLRADMKDIPADRRQATLESAQSVIARRVDLYGINEAVVQTSQQGDEYRLIVELPGVKNTGEALQLIGRTAQMEFKLERVDATESPVASDSAQQLENIVLDNFEATGLTGKDLKSAAAEYLPDTGQHVIALSFTNEGTKLFGEITQNNVGKPLLIYLDGAPVTTAVISQPILTGQAHLTGGFTQAEAQRLAIQLNAGALPVSIEILEQRVVGASLGQDSINKTVQAGVIGLVLVMIFMVLNYGFKGVLAVIALILYGIYTVALYKLLGVTLTVPGIAGLLLSIGMAVDSNILIFERMKDELRVGRPFHIALEKGFGRAWNSIKDANTVTILVALLLINPLNLSFLNTSGLVRGFGVTLLLGIVVSLFTGLVVSRTLMRLFLKESQPTVGLPKSGVGGPND